MPFFLVFLFFSVTARVHFTTVLLSLRPTYNVYVFYAKMAYLQYKLQAKPLFQAGLPLAFEHHLTCVQCLSSALQTEGFSYSFCSHTTPGILTFVQHHPLQLTGLVQSFILIILCKYTKVMDVTHIFMQHYLFNEFSLIRDGSIRWVGQKRVSLSCPKCTSRSAEKHCAVRYEHNGNKIE